MMNEPQFRLLLDEYHDAIMARNGDKSAKLERKLIAAYRQQAAIDASLTEETKRQAAEIERLKARIERLETVSGKVFLADASDERSLALIALRHVLQESN